MFWRSGARAVEFYNITIALSQHQPDRRVVSRREALRTCVAASAAPLLSGCRRRSNSPPDTSVKTPVDEMPLPPLPHAELRMRVRVHRGSKTITVGEKGRWLRMLREEPRPIFAPTVRTEVDLATDADEQPAFIGRGTLALAPLRITIGEDGWVVLDDKGFRPYTDALEPLWIEPAIDVKTAGLTLDDQPHHGVFRLQSRTDRGPQSFDVVNHVPLEQYLPGVLAGELYSHWHEQTHMAQAVAARSFAAAEAAWFATRRHYDVTNTDQSQMYTGAVADSKAQRAVLATRGIMLSWNLGLVSGYYSACCGGLAAAASDVIGDHPVNTVPPLAGRSGLDVCTEASVYQRTITCDRQLLIQRLRAYARAHNIQSLKDLDSVHAINIADRNAHGRPRDYHLVAAPDAQPIIVPARRMQRAVNYTDKSIPPPDKPLRSSFCEFRVDDDSVTISNRGFGHGAGLCQYGAEALARDNHSWRDILKWYYPQVELRVAYA